MKLKIPTKYNKQFKVEQGFYPNINKATQVKNVKM